MLEVKKKLKVNNNKYSTNKAIFSYTIIAIVSGFFNFLFILLVNRIIDISITATLPNENNFLLIFISVVTFLFIIRRLLSEGIIKLSQNIFWEVRKDIILAIIKSPYQKVVFLKDEIYASLTSDVNNITNASLLIINFISSIILIITTLIYLCYLSYTLFLISFSIILLGILIYSISYRTNNEYFKSVREIEQQFISSFNSVLNGIKEIKINQKKGGDIFQNTLSPIMKEGKLGNTKAYIGYLNSQLISQMLFYILIMIILIYANTQFNIELSIVISFVFTILYLLGPIVNVMNTIPALNIARVSLNKLNSLKKELEYNIINNEDTVENSTINYFKSIRYERYEYKFNDESFSIGPINLVINRNELIFVYGGNGSGKTTFINSLLHLYIPDKGKAFINGKLINKKNISLIKNLFAPVFSDFYLFNQFYGLDKINEKKINHYIDLFELNNQVAIVKGRFTTTDLSTGQRKRLALIYAILEERPILVLDEWAADQDPYFRKKFYTKILRQIIKKENLTIIAITHDDKYFKEADRLFKMEYGKLKEVPYQNTDII